MCWGATGVPLGCHWGREASGAREPRGGERSRRRPLVRSLPVGSRMAVDVKGLESGAGAQRSNAARSLGNSGTGAGGGFAGREGGGSLGRGLEPVWHRLELR